VAGRSGTGRRLGSVVALRAGQVSVGRLGMTRQGRTCFMLCIYSGEARMADRLSVGVFRLMAANATRAATICAAVV